MSQTPAAIVDAEVCSSFFANDTLDLAREKICLENLGPEQVCRQKHQIWLSNKPLKVMRVSVSHVSTNQEMIWW